MKTDLLFFKAAAHLEAYVETVEVANGEYGACWDAGGRLLELSFERSQSTVFAILPYEVETVRVG
jgi:hypothetical protein